MVRFILGLARSGKTRRIMEEIRNIVEEAPPVPSLRAVLVVPEQYSHNAERHLLAVCGDRLSLSAEALSFTRLASRVFEECGVTARFVSGGGRLLTLYRAMTQMQAGLKVYGGAALRADYLSVLSDTLYELKNSCITPDALTEASGNTTGVLSKKLHDLALLLAATDALYAQNGAADATDAVTLTADLIPDTQYTRAALYFDGYSDFTEPEMRVISALIRTNADMTFCFTCDGLDDGGETFEIVRASIGRIINECAKYNCDYEISQIPGGTSPEKPCRNVTLLTAADQYNECEYAASVILELVRGGYHWGDIAVMSRSIGLYGKLCERVMERYGIPVFRAGREDILHKSPVLFPLTALNIAVTGWETDLALSLIKTALSGLTREESDCLENYIIKYSIRKRQWQQKEAWTFSGGEADKKYDDLRRRLAEPVSVLQNTLKSTKTCGEKLHALYNYLEAVGFARSLDVRSEELRRSGAVRLANEYVQLWNTLMDAFDEMHLLAADYPVTNMEFIKLFQLVLSRYDVGVIPAALDRVTVGEFTRARRRDIRALIVLGATDELIPLTADSGGVLSHKERETAISLGLRLSGSSADMEQRELNIIYSALTLPSEHLFISAPETERVSYIVPLLARNYDVSPRRIPPSEYMTSALLPYREFSAIASNGAGSPSAPEALSAGTVSALFGENLLLSATRAENWNMCRYSFFFRNALKAKERKAESFDAPVSGTFVHYVMEHVTRDVMNNGGFAAVSDDFIRKSVGNASALYEIEHLKGLENRTERFRYLFNRMARDAERIAIDTAGEIRRGEFEPVSFETEFTVNVSDSLRVAGIIDRVDIWNNDGNLYLRVADYKTGGKSFELTDIFYGLNMQMLIYLCAVTSGKNISEFSDMPAGLHSAKQVIPSAALYIPARDITVSLPRNASDEDVEAELSKKLRRSGLLLDNNDILEAMERGEKRYLPLKKTNDSTYAGSFLLPLDKIEILTRYAMSQMRGISDGIRSGEVAPSPYYRSENDFACLYCEYRIACSFGISAKDKPRYITKQPHDKFWEAAERGASAT